MQLLLTWNMNGGDKWYQVGNFFRGVVRLEVACLQECGTPPIDKDNPMQLRLGDNAQYKLYSWRQRGGNLYISWYDWGVAKTNIAIVTRQQPDNWITADVSQAAAGRDWRPIIGLKIRTTWYFCLHGISPGGADDLDLILQALKSVIDRQIAGTDWYVAGDFNADPNVLQDRLLKKYKQIRDRVIIRRPDSPTYKANAWNGPTKFYDYLICNNAPEQTAEPGENIGPFESDHSAVMFQIRIR